MCGVAWLILVVVSFVQENMFINAETDFMSLTLSLLFVLYKQFINVVDSFICKISNGLRLYIRR